MSRKVTEARVVPVVKTYNGRDDDMVYAQVDTVQARIYRSVLSVGGEVISRKVMVDIEAPSSAHVVVTLNGHVITLGEVSA